jgi:flagellar biogenesis protein FliO
VIAVILAAAVILPSEEAAPVRRIAAPGAARTSEPSAAGVAAGTLAVLALAGAAALLARASLRRAGLFSAPGGFIEVLGRRPLGGRQELVLVAIGKRVVLVGSTREALTTLGEFTRDDVPAPAPEKT